MSNLIEGYSNNIIIVLSLQFNFKFLICTVVCIDADAEIMEDETDFRYQ